LSATTLARSNLKFWIPRIDDLERGHRVVDGRQRRLNDACRPSQGAARDEGDLRFDAGVNEPATGYG
jgi:hypothetical protein